MDRALPAPLARLQIEHRKIEDLKVPERQLRAQNAKADTALAAVIRQTRVMLPLVVDAEGVVRAGLKRLRVARELGLEEVPTVQVTHLGPEQLRLLTIADNRMVEMSSFDETALSLELKELDALKLDFALELTGFDGAELDVLIDGPVAKMSGKADVIPEAEAMAVTRLGDVLRLGRHRLVCGDARDQTAYQALLGDHQARMAFADVPYNVKINGHAGGKGRHARREFVMASGEMSTDEFTEFVAAAMKQMAAATLDGSIHYFCIDWRHLPEMLAAGRQQYTELKNLAVWVKENAGMGTFYRSQHELIPIFKNGTAKHLNTFGLGETGRHRSNVLNYPGMNSFGRGRDEALSMHATVKPVALVADLIRDVSRRGEWVLDPFAGSGTTAVAAEKTGRRAALIELDPLYCDVICRRWRSYSGEEASLEATGASFSALEQARAAE